MLKKVLKKVLPDAVIEKGKKFIESRHVLNDSFRDALKYKKYYNYNSVGDSSTGIKELLIFHTHSLEKGLSHPNFRDNFGKGALTGIKENLIKFNESNLSKNSFEYQNAISVLKYYKDLHESKGIVTPFFDSLFDLNEIKSGNDIAGASKHTNDDPKKMDFDQLQQFRTSQREFSKEPVDSNVFNKVVGMALKTPSVCNRQPWRAYVTDDQEKIAELLELQGGFTGYDLPPVLSLITVDNEAFIGSHERNEPYIDGGLFLMNYVFSLTYYGLASCILNTMLIEDKKAKVKKILDVSSSESLIGFVAVGYPKDDLTIANSARKPVDEVLKIR